MHSHQRYLPPKKGRCFNVPRLREHVALLLPRCEHDDCYFFGNVTRRRGENNGRYRAPTPPPMIPGKHGNSNCVVSHNARATSPEIKQLALGYGAVLKSASSPPETKDRQELFKMGNLRQLSFLLLRFFLLVLLPPHPSPFFVLFYLFGVTKAPALILGAFGLIRREQFAFTMNRARQSKTLQRPQEEKKKK